MVLGVERVACTRERVLGVEHVACIRERVLGVERVACTRERVLGVLWRNMLKIQTITGLSCILFYWVWEMVADRLTAELGLALIVCTLTRAAFFQPVLVW
jgi:hypothetical protein